MKRFISMFVTILVAMVFLTGCGCKHEWEEATCTTPKTCALCGETEGDTLGHSWTDATCTTPKTCSACGKTEGTTGDHTWTEATFTTPKTCSICGQTEGKVVPVEIEYNPIAENGEFISDIEGFRESLDTVMETLHNMGFIDYIISTEVDDENTLVVSKENSQDDVVLISPINANGDIAKTGEALQKVIVMTPFDNKDFLSDVMGVIIGISNPEYRFSGGAQDAEEGLWAAIESGINCTKDVIGGDHSDIKEFNCDSFAGTCLFMQNNGQRELIMISYGSAE